MNKTSTDLKTSEFEVKSPGKLMYIELEAGILLGRYFRHNGYKKYGLRGSEIVQAILANNFNWRFDYTFKRCLDRIFAGMEYTQYEKAEELEEDDVSDNSNLLVLLI